MAKTFSAFLIKKHTHNNNSNSNNDDDDDDDDDDDKEEGGHGAGRESRAKPPTSTPSSTHPSSGKYIPPALRRAMQDDAQDQDAAWRRRVTGLGNKLSVANVQVLTLARTLTRES